MRWILNYIRQMLCKHDFELLTKVQIYMDEGDNLPIKTRYIYRCQKCGYISRVNL